MACSAIWCRPASNTPKVSRSSTARSKTCAKPARKSSILRRPGSTCARSPRPRRGRTAEYEKLYVQNAYLERLGPNRPYKTIQEMIQKTGTAKFDKAMIDALSLEPPAQSADYAARVRNKDMVKQVIVDLIDKYQLDAVVYPYSTLPPPRWDAKGRRQWRR